MARGARLSALLLALALRAGSRPLPDKNELSNACYFTYRVGYIICDTNLSPEEAEVAMKAKQCNEDFRMLASDFQRKVVQHYYMGAPPPLEEVTWLLNSPENFQVRTMKECPPMQVIAYTLMAEAKLFMYGLEQGSSTSEMANLAVQQSLQVEPHVYSSLSKAWPMEEGFVRFQATANRLRELAESRATAVPAYEVHVVMCRCDESLEWLSEPLPLLGDQASTLFVYEGCAGSSDAADRPNGVEGFRSIPSGQDFLGARSECSAQGVLEHAMGVLVAREGQAPAFTVFLSAAAPEDAMELRLLRMTLQSLEKRTLDLDYLPLALERSPPLLPTACERTLWPEFFGPDIPRGYRGARFVVSGERLRKPAPAEHYGRLLALLEAPPAECADGARDLLAPAWHAVFGEPAAIPTRADNEATPLFLRFADGPSGFQGTRMPFSSSYLASLSADATLS